jgi:hypothetical protein
LHINEKIKNISRVSRSFYTAIFLWKHVIQ